MPVFRALLIATLAGLFACKPPVPGKPGSKADGESNRVHIEQHQDETDIVDVPETGISLGWGYDAYRNQPIPNVCVLFVESNEPAQTRTMSMHEVSDSYELMRRMNVSAEASVDAIGFKANGKASFAKDSNLSANASNFVLEASVENGVRYAGPMPLPDAKPMFEQPLVTSRGGTSGSVRLTEAALQLAKRDVEEFQRQCGNSFVSAVYSGAKLTALVSIKAENRAERQKISSEVSASGWGATASASASGEQSSTASSKDMTLSVFMTGGRGDSIPRDKAEVTAKLETLSNAAFEAPKDFHMAITPYESLPNWPGFDLVGSESEFEQLAGLWGAYNTLYDEIQSVLDAPGSYYAPVRVDGSLTMVNLGRSTPGGLREIHRLERLQDEVRATLLQLRAAAQDCISAEDDLDTPDCAFDESGYRSSYEYRIQLPLAAQEVTRNNTKTIVAPEATTAVQEVIDRYVRDKSRSRCALDMTDQACLANSEIARLGQHVGLYSLRLPDSEEFTEFAKRLGEGFELNPATASVWFDSGAESQHRVACALASVDAAEAKAVESFIARKTSVVAERSQPVDCG
ncbi:MAG: hypothetical protein R3E77_02585 [Steroidobacteraceae bacterium]